MAESPQQLMRTLWVGLFLLFGLLAIAAMLSVAEMKNRQPPLPVIGPVADFTLTNQDGRVTTLADLTNHVWIADIIFTRCAGPCPRLTTQMKSLQNRLPQNSNVKLVTLTTDPDYDSPAILTRYGKYYGADFSRWMFLTGTRSQIAALATGSLKMSATPVAPADQQNAVDLFVHATIFCVVDKHGRFRAFFQTGGQDVDWDNKIRPSLLATVRRLEREP